MKESSVRRPIDLAESKLSADGKELLHAAVLLPSPFLPLSEKQASLLAPHPWALEARGQRRLRGARGERAQRVLLAQAPRASAALLVMSDDAGGVRALLQ